MTGMNSRGVYSSPKARAPKGAGGYGRRSPANAGAQASGTQMRGCLTQEDTRGRGPGQSLGGGLPENPDAVLGRVRSELRRQQRLEGLLGCGREFRLADQDGDGFVSVSEFGLALKRLGLSLAPREEQALFQHFDKDGRKLVDYEEFLQALRGKMSQRRREVVDEAFDAMDTEARGYLDVTEVATRFDAARHPDVRRGHREPLEVLRAFLKAFDVGGAPQGRVTKEQWRRFYEQLSQAVESDDYFEEVIRSSWRLPAAGLGAPGAGAPGSPTRRPYYTAEEEDEERYNTTNRAHFARPEPQQRAAELDGPVMRDEYGRRLYYMQARGAGASGNPTGGLYRASPWVEDLVSRVRDSLRAQGTAGDLMGCLAYQQGRGGASGAAVETPEDLREILGRLRVNLRPEEAETLFTYFSAGGASDMDLLEFTERIFLPLSFPRQRMVKTVFEVLDNTRSAIKGSGSISIGVLRRIFDVNSHPDVAWRVRTRESVWREFEACLDAGGDGQVTEPMLQRYYRSAAFMVQTDQRFKEMLRSTWRLTGQQVGDGGVLEEGKRAAEERSPDMALSWKRSGMQRTVERVPPNLRPGQSNSRSSAGLSAEGGPFSSVLDKVRESMLRRGGEAIAGMGRKFRQADEDNDGWLTQPEFSRVVQDLQLPVQRQEEEKLFAHLDRQREGRVYYEEFLDAIRGPLSERRLALVDRVFDKLDHNQKGMLDATELAIRFDATKHPEADRGGKKPIDLMKSFLKSFDFSAAPQGWVSKEAWRRYYRGVSAGFEDDQAFEKMLRRVWRMK